MTAGRRLAVVGAAAGVLLGALTAAVLAVSGRPFPVDAAVHDWFLGLRAPTLVAVERVVTASASGLPAYTGAAVAGCLTGRPGRRWWLGGVAAVAALAAVQGLRLALAAAVHRARPPRADWATTAGGWSFPSGHTTTAAAVAVLLVLALGRVRSRSARVVGTTAALLWAAAVGLTRVGLGVHWPSDVLGGWLLVAALSATATAVRWARSRRAPRAAATPSTPLARQVSRPGRRLDTGRRHPSGGERRLFPPG